MIYKGYFDGSSKGNPGPAQCGWAVLDDQDEIVDHEIRSATEDRTNNVAEYMGIIELFKYIFKTNKISSINIFGDSKLVVEQLNGKWKCKSPNIKPYYEVARRLLIDLNNKGKVVTIIWVPREENTIADSLAQKGEL